jgi:predicted RNA-binding protein with EMAP domain
MKDYLRDYATAAFRFYAKNGRSADKYREQIYNQALEEINRRETLVKDGISKPTEAAIMAAEKAVNEKIAEIKDMEAVEKVIAEFKSSWKSHIVHAIELVYFKDAENDMSIGDIQDRVIAAAVEISASERSVYYWLREARELFALNRGLRI